AGPRWPVRLRPEEDRWALRDSLVLALLRRNVGSIITEETRTVVIAEASANCNMQMANGKLVGEVDEAFGDRLQAGDRFLLDGRCLEFRHRISGRLIVDEVFGWPPAPHWHGEGWPLAPELARRFYLLRGQAAEMLREGRSAFREAM